MACSPRPNITYEIIRPDPDLNPLKSRPNLWPRISSPPLMAEASALLLAIHQALDLGFKRVSFASDSLQLIKALNFEASFKELHGIHHDILYLSLNFDCVSFDFVPRDRNRKADALAKSALLSSPTVPALI
ncbi:PREDICTED: uncharacterized protein LOC109130906 [Camelina sativa]|uniref:Uncharacterized protein LOC109130906 n=1 Tax=Camelina sativa TaxID=90675 RepID=A0ABM1RC04_CAMSA|nr:PREDICTED: uncharacterized protein LOC109130906 [Camelina sativa]